MVAMPPHEYIPEVNTDFISGSVSSRAWATYTRPDVLIIDDVRNKRVDRAGS